jgi:hypothetical protein
LESCIVRSNGAKKSLSARRHFQLADQRIDWQAHPDGSSSIDLKCRVAANSQHNVESFDTPAEARYSSIHTSSLTYCSIDRRTRRLISSDPPLTTCKLLVVLFSNAAILSASSLLSWRERRDTIEINDPEVLYPRNFGLAPHHGGVIPASTHLACSSSMTEDQKLLLDGFQDVRIF